MTANKIFLSNLGSAFTIAIVISLTSLVLLVDVSNELAESGRESSKIFRNFFSFREALQNNTGNELTGEITAWLFGTSSVPVFIDLILRKIIRYGPFAGSLTGFLQHFNQLQRKYLMPLHTYLSIAALGLGILHLTLSACIANPFPELGLILAGILVVTGLLFKCRDVPPFLRKAFYKFHASLIVSGVLLVILYSGHAVMDSD